MGKHAALSVSIRYSISLVFLLAPFVAAVRLVPVMLRSADAPLLDICTRRSLPTSHSSSVLHIIFRRPISWLSPPILICMHPLLVVLSRLVLCLLADTTLPQIVQPRFKPSSLASPTSLPRSRTSHHTSSCCPATRRTQYVPLLKGWAMMWCVLHVTCMPFAVA